MDSVTTRAATVALLCRDRQLGRDVEAAVRLEPELRWQGTAEGILAALRLCESDQPDVMVVDSRNDPGRKLCLMLTALFPRLTAVALLNEGADDPAFAPQVSYGSGRIVCVDAGSDGLGAAVRDSVSRGRRVGSGMDVSMSSSGQRGDLRGKPLSARELEVLRLIADGRTAENIGHRLGITADTVRTHIYRILRKLNARDRAHAVALSFQMSLLPTQPPAPRAEIRDRSVMRGPGTSP